MSGQKATDTADRLDTPEPPSLCTPGFKIKKPDGQCFTPEQEQGDPECPLLPGSPSTPELPPFQTPYVKRLVSTKKRAQPDALDGPSDGEHLETPGRGSTSTWQHREEDKPEMPHLESSLGNYLTTKNGDLPKVGESAKVGKDTAVSSLELDRTTQGFSLPRSFQEPSTPEMPDLSSVTQDICKLVLQAQRKNTSTASQLSDVRPESDRHCPVGETKGLSLVSQSEFETLPDYLRCMPLSSLNQAVRNINRSTNGSEGLMTTCTTEELRRISSVGTRAPVYILCLQELKRLKQVEGSASVYQLITAKE
ncbi:spindle and kinetochore-associated protein 3 [Nematolebias whitei]|uniref:spindle and kinetochore-associated protein 3 n=1 Tax=Nematolebias whitei TaxID=451745 RepID=UPI001896F7CE|nr:spindle and kinetochore-associated protein 3 [Nematolebias whitei]